MHEISSVPELAHHSYKIVVRPDAERAGAEAKSVGPVRHGGDELTEILCRGKDSRKSENRERRIIRVDHHPDSDLISHRADLAQEEDKVASEFLGINPVIPFQFFSELVQSEALLAARKACDHRAGKFVDFLGIHLLETGLGLGDVIG